MKNPQGGRPTIDYWLTLDAAKEMAMLERNEAGKRIRRYLIDVEKKFRAQRLQPDLNDPRVLLRYLHDTSGKLIESQERVAALEDSNELLTIGLKLESEGRQVAELRAAEVKQTVKTLAAKIDAPIKGVNLTSFAKDTAAVLGYSVHGLIEYLIDTGVVFRARPNKYGDTTILPTREFERRGLFQMKRSQYYRQLKQRDEHAGKEVAVGPVVAVDCETLYLTPNVSDSAGRLVQVGGYSWLLERMLKDPRTQLSRLIVSTGGPNGRFKRLAQCKLHKTCLLDLPGIASLDEDVILIARERGGKSTHWFVGKRVGATERRADAPTLTQALELLHDKL